MKIICISGKARAGKDELARFMRGILVRDEHEVLVIHYADLLKYICSAYFGWDGRKDELGRALLQYVGTDVVRKKQENFWVDFIISFLHIFDKEWDYVIIPDCRYPNEIDKLKDNGYDVSAVRVRRDTGLGGQAGLHSSETSMDNYHFDYEINNEGDLAELRKKALELTGVIYEEGE